MNPTLSIIMPTLTSRLACAERAEQVYRDATEESFEIIRVLDRPAWGEALNYGCLSARGSYLHFACDDMWPCAGWDVAALEATHGGGCPAATITYPGGELMIGRGHTPDENRDLLVLPFLNRRTYEHRLAPMLNTHYFADNALTDRVRALGYPLIVWPEGYRFEHQVERTGQRDQAAMLRHDIAIYNHATRFAGLTPSLPMPRLEEESL